MNNRQSPAENLETLSEAKGSVSILAEEKMSFDQLKEISRQHEVIFTPHVGNKWREDLYLIDAGIETANFERNASVLDVLDNPHKLKVGGLTHQLSTTASQKSPILTPYLKLADDLHPEAEQFTKQFDAQKPGQLHHRSTLAALHKGKSRPSAKPCF